MGYRIEKAKEADWEPAMALAYRVFLKYESTEYGEEGTKNFFNFVSSKELKQMFLIGEYPMFVAKDGNQVVGMISLRSGNHISLLFVEENYHRKGVGTSLMKQLIAFLKENTKYRSVTVNASPYGEPFYHQFGFVDIGKLLNKDGMIYTPMECFY